MTDIPDNWKLLVDGIPLFVAKSVETSDNRAYSATWEGTGLSWSADDTVSLKIIPDTKPPGLESVVANAGSLVLTYDKALDEGSVPAGTAYRVSVGGTAVALASGRPVAVSGRTVTLALAVWVAPADTVTVTGRCGDERSVDAAQELGDLQRIVPGIAAVDRHGPSQCRQQSLPRPVQFNSLFWRASSCWRRSCACTASGSALRS